jgi:pathogenesis-related protein 1
MTQEATLGRASRLGKAARLGAALTVAMCFGGCSLHDEQAESDDGNNSGATSNGSGGSGASNQGGTSTNSGGKASGGKASGGTAGTASGGTASTPVQTDFPDAQVYVDAHNAVRAAVEQPANYASAWEPLPPVSWSDEVAITSQEWANHLRDTMDCGLQHANGTGYGENLAAGSNVGAQRAVDMWADEKENYVYSPEYDFSGDTGHYTQIVWRKSIRIGCASAQCGGSSVVVCRYDPPGNYIGDEIF